MNPWESLAFRHALAQMTLAMVAGATLAPAPAIAQNIIEEILVTARKRTENLQEVPAAVSAFSGEELLDRGVDNIVEVARLTPNVTINETNGLIAGAVQVFIRGIGNDPGFDQGVGIYVDDVYLNRTGGGLLEVYDVERIEVLKGPQGNLYGRNTTGGALKYVSREPDNETRIRLEGKYGEDNLVKMRASFSGALVEDSLFASFAVAKMDHDGYQTNTYDDSEYAAQDKLAMRGTLIWEAADSLQFKLVGDMMRDDSDPYVPTRVAVNLGGPAGLGAFGALLGTANAFVPGMAYLAPGEMLDTSLPADIDDVNTASSPAASMSTSATPMGCHHRRLDLNDAVAEIHHRVAHHRHPQPIRLRRQPPGLHQYPAGVGHGKTSPRNCS